MKKVLLALLVLILLASLSVFFVACNQKELTSPSDLSVSDGVLIWSKVENASGYIVNVDGVEYSVGLNYYELSVEIGKSVEIKVKAVGEGNYSDSPYSEIYTYKNAVINELIKLNTPQITEITGDGRVYWSYVSNCSGYKIYKNNSVIATIKDSKTTDYLLEINTVGSYGIQVQAVGDRKTYSDSGKSNIYRLVIEENGKPTLPSLTSPTISYDPSSRSLVWDRVRRASSYDIYLNGTKIDSTTDTSYQINPVLKSNSYQVVAIGDGVKYGNSKLGNAIAFPLEPDSYPQNLTLKVVDGERRLVWDEQPYSIGYEVEINGSLVETKNEYMLFPTYKDGTYVVRVRSKGDNLVYYTSNFSNELEINIKGGQIASERLLAPESISFHDGKVEWSAVDGADYYELLVETPYDDTLTDFKYNVNGLNYTMEEALLDSVLVFYIRAFSNSDIYSPSVYTKGIGFVPSARNEIMSDDGYVTIIEGDQYSFLSSPTALSYDGQRITWTSVSGASGYKLNIGEQQFSLTDCFMEYTFEGEVVVSVSATTDLELTYPSPRSLETCFSGKKRLATPIVSLNGSILSWQPIQNVEEYLITIDGVDSFFSNSTSFELKNVIDVDGEYTIHVVAVSQDSYYLDSLRSNEISFTADYGRYGTKEKPFVIESIDNLQLIKDNPHSYFKFSVKELDFNNEEIEPLFTSSVFYGYIYGEGVLIKNATIKAVDGISSFFGVLQGASIENITFENIKISSAITQGVLASKAIDCDLQSINIVNCTIDGQATHSGGLVGIGSGAIFNCNTSVTIQLKPIGSNSLYVGGIVGSFSGSIEFCTATLEFTSLSSDSGEVLVGGIAGSLTGNVKDVEVKNTTLNVNNDGYAGLGFGQLIGNGEDVRFAGSVIGKSSKLYLGGVGGLTSGTISGSVSGLISGDGHLIYIGGASGSGGVFSLTVKTKLRASADKLYLGGISGSNSDKLTIDSLELDIVASANEGFIGGIVGMGSAEGVLSGVVELNIKNKNVISTMRIGYLSGSSDDRFENSPVKLSGDAVTAYTLAGEGTEDSPYLISVEKDFSFIEKYPGAYFKLERDITFSGNHTFNATTPFSGVLDGQGHTLYSLYSSGEESALIVNGENATIKNITIESATILSGGVAGILVAKGKGCSFENCYVSGRVSGKGVVGGFIGESENCSFKQCGFDGYIYTNSGISGGFAGILSGSVSECYANCTESDAPSSSFAGFANEIAQSSTIINSYAIAVVKRGGNVAGFAISSQGEISNSYSMIECLSSFEGFVNGGVVNNCCYILPTFITPENSSDAIAISSKNVFDGVFEGDCWDNSKGFSLLKNVKQWEHPYSNGEYEKVILNDTLTLSSSSFNFLDYATFGTATLTLPTGVTLNNGVLTFDSVGVYQIGVEYLNNSFTWTVDVNSSVIFAKGSGSELDPYIIENDSELLSLEDYAGCYFAMGCNLTLSQSASFYGYLDGKGYILTMEAPFNNVNGSISNLTIAFNGDQKGIFALQGQSVTLTDITVNGSGKTSALIYEAEDSTFDKVTLNLEVEGKGEIFGGIASSSTRSNYKNITANVNIYSGNRVGGIVGNSQRDSFENIILNVTIAGEHDYAGGISAKASSSVNGVEGSVSISGVGNYCGGLFAENSGTIENAQITVNATCTSVYFGGLVAKSSGKVSGKATLNCEVSGCEYFGGGVATGNNVDIEVISKKLNVSTSNKIAYIGGVIGDGNGSVSISGDMTVNAMGNLICGYAIAKANHSNVTAKGALTVIILSAVKQLSDRECLIGGGIGEGSITKGSVEVTLTVTDNISSTLYIGGIIGSGSISEVKGVVDIHVTTEGSSYIGGFSGVLGMISSSDVEGSISSCNSKVGSITGLFINSGVGVDSLVKESTSSISDYPNIGEERTNTTEGLML